MSQTLVVVGAGGQARDTAWLAREIGFNVLGFVVSDLARIGEHDSEVLGDESWLDHNVVDALAIGIGSPSVRARVAKRLSSNHPRTIWPTLVHPSARLDWDTAVVGKGVTIGANVVGTVNIQIDDFAVLNPAVTLGHEAVVGRACVMNHASGISGGTILEDEVLIGTGARVLQYLRVGHGARVGAGAVVTKNVPKGVTVVGVPARTMGAA